MTNTDQDVLLDEMAKSVCDYMDWDCYEDENYGWQFETGETEHIKGNPRRVGTLVYEINALWTSLDVIREVEKALKDNDNLWPSYISELMIETGYHEGQSIRNRRDLELATADPETRLRAIYKTLKEAGG